MDLWIRNQNKERLSKTTNIYVNGYNNRWAIYGYSIDSVHDFVLGIYKTKERALEVLEEIQRTITKVLVNKNNDLTGKYSLEVIDTVIYEMPEE